MTVIFFSSQEIKIICAECGKEIPQVDTEINSFIEESYGGPSIAHEVSTRTCLECLNKARKSYYDLLKRQYKEKHKVTARVKFRRVK